jgi:hypothetical protein
MAAKITIPDELKADVPPTKWGKLLVATPIVMTVVSTMLAGLASSEMTRAQYDRSLAAQLQSKAGDQWGLFQAKKLRNAIQHSTLDLLQATTALHPLDAAGLPLPVSEQTLAALKKGGLPEIPAGAPLDPDMKAALDAIENSKPDAEIKPLLARVKDGTLAEALTAAKDRALAFDAALKPVNQDIDSIEKSLTAGTASDTLVRDFTTARLRFMAARYDAEARLNQAIANVYELQVRKSNVSAERHHNRSQRFFYGMLAAQMGVIISTFAIAARQRNLLWSLAAAAGVAAISFAIYVYLWM